MRTSSPLRSVFLVASACLAFLIFLPAAHAAVVNRVNPSEGSIGTLFIISGSGFGWKKGEVSVGPAPCQTLVWSNRVILCRIDVPMPPGAYDLALAPRGGGPALTLPNAFTIMGESTPVVDLVNPREGTVGTTFIISGSDFGRKTGSVWIGSWPCRTLSWSDTSIMCLVKVPMAPGDYDLVLKPGKGSPLRVANGFTIMAPELEAPEYRPHFVSPGDIVTVYGDFFGDRPGRHKVQVENLRGERRTCRVLDWAMDAITFRLPRRMSGLVHLTVSNSVGSDTQPWWGTFADPPENPSNLLGSYTGMTTHENATAVSYLNNLWAFYPHVDDDHNRIGYRRWDGKDWSAGHYLRTTEGVDQKSKAQINPLLADDILYVFYTGTNGKLYYLVYDFVQTQMDKEEDSYAADVWRPEKTIPGAQVADVGGRFAAVYNFTRKWIEVYWTPDSANVYMKTYTPDGIDTGTWSETRTVLLPRGDNLPIAPYLTAVFNQLVDDNEDDFDYVTYLSWSDGSAGYLAELKDGEIIADGDQLRYVYSTDWRSVNSKRGPSLADLTYDHLAVIVNRKSDRSYYHKYDKNAHAPVGSAMLSVPFTSKQDTSWAPTGVTFSKREADSQSPTGVRMTTNFYAFVGNNPIAADTKWEFVNCESLGYWLPTSDIGTEIDLSDLDIMEDSFEMWPLLGVVDMPPYVENGHQCTQAEWEKCGTEVEISFEQATEEGLSVDFSVGPYYRTRARNPVEAEVGAGYALAFEDTTKKTYTHTDKLEASRHGVIMAYYFVPTFRMFELEWYDYGDTPTGVKTVSMEVSGAEIKKEAFRPYEGPGVSKVPPPYLDPAVFPYHDFDDDFERLDSYRITDPTDYFQSEFNPIYCQWFPESPCDFGLRIENDHQVDQGGYFNFKLGVKTPVGVFGAEGDLKIMHKSNTEKGVEAHTYFQNSNTFEGAGPWVESFEVEGYWLKGDNSGYWVPEYRRAMGDTPWFVTYRVTHYVPPEP